MIALGTGDGQGHAASRRNGGVKGSLPPKLKLLFTSSSRFHEVESNGSLIEGLPVEKRFLGELVRVVL